MWQCAFLACPVLHTLLYICEQCLNYFIVEINHMALSFSQTVLCHIVTVSSCALKPFRSTTRQKGACQRPKLCTCKEAGYSWTCRVTTPQECSVHHSISSYKAQFASLSPSEKKSQLIGWGDEKGTVPHGLQLATRGVSDHCRQLWRRQLSPSRSGNKSSLQMFGRSQLSLNERHLNMNLRVIVGKFG